MLHGLRQYTSAENHLISVQSDPFATIICFCLKVLMGSWVIGVEATMRSIGLQWGNFKPLAHSQILTMHFSAKITCQLHITDLRRMNGFGALLKSLGIEPQLILKDMNLRMI